MYPPTSNLLPIQSQLTNYNALQLKGMKFPVRGAELEFFFAKTTMWVKAYVNDDLKVAHDYWVKWHDYQEKTTTIQEYGENEAAVNIFYKNQTCKICSPWTSSTFACFVPSKCLDWMCFLFSFPFCFLLDIFWLISTGTWNADGEPNMTKKYHTDTKPRS